MIINCGCTLLGELNLIISVHMMSHDDRYNPARRVSVYSGEEYVSVDTLISSVIPTTIRLHHKGDIINICACGSLVMLGMMVSPVAIVTIFLKIRIIKLY